MGLFDRLISNKPIHLTPQAGLLLSAITMVAIDGEVDDDELAIIRRLDGSANTEAWEAAVKTWKTTRSVDERVSLATAAMNQKQRLVAIANLIDIAMADGVLAGAEERLLEAFVDAFDIDESIVETIVKVIAIKNDRSDF